MIFCFMSKHWFIRLKVRSLLVTTILCVLFLLYLQVVLITVRTMADLGESAAPSSPGAVAMFFKRIGDVCFTVLISLYRKIHTYQT